MANKVLVDTEEGYTVPSWIDRIDPFMQKVLSEAGYDGEELSVLFCSDPFIQELNKQYRKIDAPTDVLSFENGEKYTDEEGSEWIEAGDIVISLDTLPKNCLYFDVSADEELKRLLIHGMLHLNGYDHGEEHVEKGVEPECEMLKIQKRLLEALSSESVIG